MGILGNVTDGVTGSIDNILSTFKNPFGNKTAQRFAPDFTEGFVIQEYIDGVPGERLVLQAENLPKQPFKFGGEQKIVKDYYAGNSEPVVQVLGSREDATTIRGTLKAKRFDNPSGKKEGGLYGAPEAFQRQLDAFRIRGNLCQFTLGEWKRWGFIGKTEFDMQTLARIDYQVTLEIVGFNKPINAKFVDRTKELPFAINKKLIDEVNSLEDAPVTMPKTLAGVLNGLTSDMAKAIGLVTNFVDTTLKTAEDVEGSLNRAIGLIKNARANISIFKRRLRTIFLTGSSLGTTAGQQLSGLVTDSRKAAAINANALRNGSYILGAMSSTNNLAAILANMQATFEALRKTTPLARYLVKDGDTLQRIAIKFYQNADKWKAIYDHNKLTSTQLSRGSILEIPRQ